MTRVRLFYVMLIINLCNCVNVILYYFLLANATAEIYQSLLQSSEVSSVKFSVCLFLEFMCAFTKTHQICRRHKPIVGDPND